MHSRYVYAAIMSTCNVIRYSTLHKDVVSRMILLLDIVQIFFIYKTLFYSTIYPDLYKRFNSKRCHGYLCCCLCDSGGQNDHMQDAVQQSWDKNHTYTKLIGSFFFFDSLYTMMQKSIRLIVFLFITLFLIFLSGNFFFNKNSKPENKTIKMAQFQVVLREGVVGGFVGPTLR